MPPTDWYIFGLVEHIANSRVRATALTTSTLAFSVGDVGAKTVSSVLRFHRKGAHVLASLSGVIFGEDILPMSGPFSDSALLCSLYSSRLPVDTHLYRGLVVAAEPVLSGGLHRHSLPL